MIKPFNFPAFQKLLVLLQITVWTLPNWILALPPPFETQSDYEDFLFDPEGYVKGGATRLFVSGLRKFLNRKRLEGPVITGLSDQRELESKKEFTTPQIVEVTTTTTTEAPTFTTPQILEVTTATIKPIDEASRLWYNVKSIAHKIESDFNPLEPISIAIDDIKQLDVWHKIDDYANKGYSSVNRFTQTSSDAIKENFEKLENKVKNNWENLEHQFNL